MNHRLPRSTEATRREFLQQTAGTVAGLACSAAMPRRVIAGPEHSDLVAGIDRAVIFNGRASGTTWFHPRPCSLPAGDTPQVLMTLQSISGSDVFGPVHWTASDDLGRSWSDPQPIPGFGRRPLGDGWEEGVCDVVPEYHSQTRSVLAIGHNVYYRNGVLAKPQRERRPIYVVRSDDGNWSEPKHLEWDDPRATAIYTSGCSQRVHLPNGEVLLPLSFGPRDRVYRSVTTVRCSFDGRTLAIRQVGDELTNTTGRGLLEPSLTQHDGRFWLTIRAEDGRGYVCVSDDGLKWSTPQPWCWEDGEPLEMSTTQQHWLPHAEGLYLVYTRKADGNEQVMRWRAPLFMAEVDLTSKRLKRASEKVVLPLIGDGRKNPKHVARMGNFHTVAVTPDESWVTVGETLPEDGWRGDTLLARVKWSRPNTRV